MREAISNTAELGAVLGGKKIVDQSIRDRMAKVLAEVRSGRFADELRAEEASGYARLERAREEARTTLIEETYSRLAKKEG
jgi:ketol-acid reductoisomerase